MCVSVCAAPHKLLSPDKDRDLEPGRLLPIRLLHSSLMRAFGGQAGLGAFPVYTLLGALCKRSRVFGELYGDAGSEVLSGLPCSRPAERAGGTGLAGPQSQQGALASPAFRSGLCTRPSRDVGRQVHCGREGHGPAHCLGSTATQQSAFAALPVP